MHIFISLESKNLTGSNRTSPLMVFQTPAARRNTDEALFYTLCMPSPPRKDRSQYGKALHAGVVAGSGGG